MEYELISFGRYYCFTAELPKELEWAIHNALSYTLNNAKFVPNPAWAIVKLYNMKKHCFPIGLLNRVRKVVDNHGDKIIFKTEKNIIDNKTYDLNASGLRVYQREAFNQMLHNNNGIIKIPTGGGKTRIAIEFLKYANKKTLVLVPTLDLVRQWNEQLPNDKITVKTYQSIKSKSFLKDFDIIIFDECHHVAAKTLFLIGMNLNNNARVYGFSATPLNRDEHNLKVEAVLGPIIYEVRIDNLIEDGYLCDAKVIYHNIPPRDYKFAGFTYAEIYDDYVVNNSIRNGDIISIAVKAAKPCLILVNHISHGNILNKLLLSSNFDSVFVNGSVDSAARDDLSHDIIIASSIFDEGVDIPVLKTLILAGGGKSNIKIVQRVGRLLRPSKDKSVAIIHDFVDNAKYLFEHYRRRRYILENSFFVEDSKT